MISNFDASIGAYERRQQDADSLLWNIATFYADADRHVYVITVRGMIVCEAKTILEVMLFCAMHNGRIAESMA